MRESIVGDRGNIYIVERMGRETRGVFLYTHWTGSDLPEVVHKALAKEWRWHDAPYLARIVFDVLTEGDHGSETGFGISTFIPDNEHPILVLDTMRQEAWAADSGSLLQPIGQKMPFKDIVAEKPGWDVWAPGQDT